MVVLSTVEVITPAKKGIMKVPMKYTKEQRIDIGLQVFNHEISRSDAQIKCAVASSCIDRYV